LHTGFRLPPNSLTLDDLGRQNRGVLLIFFVNFWRRDTFQERIAPKSIGIDMKKLYKKFSALNVHFDGPSLDFLGSRKPPHEGIKERYPSKSRYLTAVGPVFRENG